MSMFIHRSWCWHSVYTLELVVPLQCMNTAGCTTSWVNYANERSQAALERSSQDACDVIRLIRSKTAVWTVDDMVNLIEISKKNLYLFNFYPWLHMIWRWGMTKVRSIAKLYKSTLFIDLFIYYINVQKRFIQLVVQPAVKCRHSYNRLYNRLFVWYYYIKRIRGSQQQRAI